MLGEHDQKTLDEYRAGVLDALRHLEEYFMPGAIRREYWTSEQVYTIIRSVRLTLEERFK